MAEEGGRGNRREDEREEERVSRGERRGMSEEEVRETVEEEMREFEEEREEERGRARGLTKDQLVHDAAIQARNHYGETKYTYNAEEGRYEESGWYNLVDLWLIVPKLLSEKYHERFRRWVSIFSWESRKNRHLIPYKYLISKRGIERAVGEEYISPYFRDLWTFRIGVEFPPIGPPLAYYDWFGPSKEEAERMAMQDILGKGRQAMAPGTSEMEKREVEKEEESLRREAKAVMQQLDETVEKMEQAEKGTEAYQNYKDQARNLYNRLDTLIKEHQQLVEEEEELSGSKGFYREAENLADKIGDLT